MNHQVMINGVDVTAYIDSRGKVSGNPLKIELNLSHQLTNYNSVSCSLNYTGMPGGTWSSISPLHFQEITIDDLDLLNSLVSYSDDFNRSDSSILGGSWLVPTGSIAIVSNQAKASGTSRGYIQRKGSNYAVQATCTGDKVGVIARYSDNGAGTYGGYKLYRNGTNTIFEQEDAFPSGGSSTTLATVAGAANGDVLQLYCLGTTIVAKRNGTTIATATGQTYNLQTGGFGLLNIDPAIQGIWDNLTIYASPRIFGGYIDNAVLIRKKGQNYFYDITAKDYSWLLEKQATYDSLTSTADGDIVSYFLSTYFGTMFDTSGVTNTGTAESFPAYYPYVINAIQRLCKENATRFWIDADKVAHYGFDEFPQASFGFSESGTASSTASTRTMQLNGYKEDLGGMATRVICIGGKDSASGRVENISSVDASNQYQLAYGVPTVASFGIETGVNTPLFFAMKDVANPKNTPNVTKSGSYSTVIGTPQTVYNQAWIMIQNGATYPTIYFDPGPKLVIMQIKDGITPDCFQVVQYTFLVDTQYNIYVDAGYGAFTWWITPIAAGTGGKAAIIAPTVSNNTGFTATPKALWIADGYPAVIEPTTGLIQYSACSGYSNWPVTTTVPSGSQSHTITYDGVNQVKATATNDTNRNTYGPLYDGFNHLYFDVVVKDDQILKAEDAQARAHAELVNRANGIKTGQLTTLWGRGLNTGQRLSIVSPGHNLNGTFLVNKIQIQLLLNSHAQYTVDFGNYDPGDADLIAKLLGQNDTSQDEADAANIATYLQDYTAFTTYYYGEANAIYGAAGVTYS